jgi:lambda family phage portal protein
MNFWRRAWKALNREIHPIRAMRRDYTGAALGRLTADWVTSGTSADAEIQGRLPRLRNNSRDMGRNTPYAAQLKRLYRDNIFGPAGIQLQMTVSHVRGNGINEAVGNAIETAYKKWCKRDSFDVRGKWSKKRFEWSAALSLVDSGEFIFRFVRQPFGKNNKIPLALEAIESDQLDLDYVGPLSAPDNFWRMGIEYNKWGRPQNYAILTVHPGDYLTRSTATKARKHEIIPAVDIIHGFIDDRVGQSRGVPVPACVMGEMHQSEGYEQAVTIRARAASSLMGYIQTPNGEVIGDSVDTERNERLTEFQPGTFKYLNSGEQIVVPDIKAPDNQYEQFVKNKGRRYASGTGVSYASLTRDASESSYAQQRQEYLQDQDAWSVLQAMMIEVFEERVFEEWLPLAVLAGAVKIPDFEIRPDHYLSAANWQPRGWSWVDPKKEAEGYKIMEGQDYISKIEICAKLGTTYEKVLKDKQRERELEKQYGHIKQEPAPAQSPLPAPLDDEAANE